MKMWEMFWICVKSSISADLQNMLLSHSGWFDKPLTWDAIYGRVHALNGCHNVICCYLMVIVFALGRGKSYLNICCL